MIELAGLMPKGGGGNAAEGFFFYDGPGSQTITIAKGGAAAYEPTPTIDGKTMVLSNLTDRVIITLSSPVNLMTSDWTFEWSTINTTAEVNSYANDFQIHPGDADNSVLQARFGDAGFGNRLSVGGVMNALALVYNTPNNKSNMVGVLKRFALVQKDKNISLFTNGVKEMFALGTSYTYDVASFVNDADASAAKRIVIGDWINGGSGAVPSKRGPMRLTMRALYDANYTPQPIG